jgi:GntR family transcriptional regulator/MocR family aminotransferase
LLGDYLLQRLQQDIDGTLQLRLFRCLRNAIIDSVLAPKTRLPASRDLAKEIKVSRNTVLSAYTNNYKRKAMFKHVQAKALGR